MCINLSLVRPADGEYFANITSDHIPNVRPYYMVSTCGRVYNKYSNRFLKWCYDQDGYMRYSLVTENGVFGIGIHRLMMLVFRPVPNMKNLVVNHLDGIKTNNRFDNLEWCTALENTAHTTRMNLMARGEDAARSVYTNEQVHYACRLLEQGLSTREVSELTGIKQYNVNRIRKGETWGFISSQYNIPPYKKVILIDPNDLNKMIDYAKINPREDGMSKADYCRIVLNEFGYPTSCRYIGSINHRVPM